MSRIVYIEVESPARAELGPITLLTGSFDSKFPNFLAYLLYHHFRFGLCESGRARLGPEKISSGRAWAEDIGPLRPLISHQLCVVYRLSTELLHRRD